MKKVCLICGIALLVTALAALAVWQYGIRRAETQGEAYLATLRSLLPPMQGAVPEARRDNTMPMLSVDGKEFVGILEWPRFASALPVCANWAETFPSRFSGSVYDRSMQIGATSQAGQYDFFREISVGDALFFTDMEGNRYSYTVTDLHYESQINGDTLGREEAALTLFIQNIYAFDYLVVFCNTPN